MRRLFMWIEREIVWYRIHRREQRRRLRFGVER